MKKNTKAFVLLILLSLILF